MILPCFFAQNEYFTLSFCNEDIPKLIQHVYFSNTLWPNEEYEASRILEKLNSAIRTIDFPSASCSKSFLNACFLRFKCIRVLELSVSRFEALPNSIGDLKHLRYLSLTENTVIKKLPSSICKLYHLQTLFLFGCSELEELPRGIGNMINLRSLMMTTKQRDISFQWLNSLQDLDIIHCLNFEFLLKGMGSLTALRNLAIANCPNLASLSPSIKLLTTLEVLLITSCEKLEFMDGEAEGQEDTQTFGILRILRFQDLPRLEALPRWLLHDTTSNTLRELLLADCPNIRALPETRLQKLTYLQKFEIEDCPQLTKRCRAKTGEDWQRIAHIPEICGLLSSESQWIVVAFIN